MTARHRRGLGCIVAPLPNLAPDRRTEINLLVKIFLIHLREKLLEGRFPFLNGRGNDLPVGNRQVQHRAFLDPCVFSRWFGNPNGETVSSFLNANMHLRSSLFVSTKKLQCTAFSVKNGRYGSLGLPDNAGAKARLLEVKRT
jgi:hypothetical protein